MCSVMVLLPFRTARVEAVRCMTEQGSCAMAPTPCAPIEDVKQVSCQCFACSHVAFPWEGELLGRPSCRIALLEAQCKVNATPHTHAQYRPRGGFTYASKSPGYAARAEQ